MAKLVQCRVCLFVQVASAREAGVPIRITLPDGAEVEGVKGVTTPMDVVKGLPKAVQKEESHFELLFFLFVGCVKYPQRWASAHKAY